MLVVELSASARAADECPGGRDAPLILISVAYFALEGMDYPGRRDHVREAAALGRDIREHFQNGERGSPSS